MRVEVDSHSPSFSVCMYVALCVCLYFFLSVNKSMAFPFWQTWFNRGRAACAKPLIRLLQHGTEHANDVLKLAKGHANHIISHICATLGFRCPFSAKKNAFIFCCCIYGSLCEERSQAYRYQSPLIKREEPERWRGEERRCGGGGGPRIKGKGHQGNGKL